jgi:Protein of unknown function (DUF2842)
LNRRLRTLIGGATTIAFVLLYALVAMGLAQARPVQEAPGWLQPILYGALGIAWVLPLLPLIRWMEGRDRQ